MRILVPLSLLACVALTPSAWSQQLVRSYSGTPASTLGKAVLRIGDQNSDGVDDLLVGAPGFDLGRGAIYCVSGAYLATGAGSPTLWTVAPAVNPGDLFGSSLADAGDVTGDGVRDFLVGMPGYDFGTSTNSGAVRLVNGSTHAVVSLIYDDTPGIAFGSAMAACGDEDGDGLSEVAVGAPGANPFFTALIVLAGSHLASSGNNNGADLVSTAIIGGGDAMGISVASGFDIDGNGSQEIVVGIPGRDNPGATDGGECRVLSPGLTVDINGNLVWDLADFGDYRSSVPGERFGTSVDAAHDYDGDGVVDIVAGAPNHPGSLNTQPGRMVVLSGARLRAQTPPYELLTVVGPAGTVTPESFHFGSAVGASGDLNGDGVGDILVGSPDFFTQFPIGPGKGAFAIYSGSTGVRIGGAVGSNGDRLGDVLAGAFQDLDGDGFDEFVAAGSLSDAGGTDSGVIKCYRLFPCSPSTYCTAKTNSLGCVPSMSSSGLPSASAATPFAVTCANVINQKNGILFYSHQPAAIPFQGGLLCANPPTQRTPVQSSGGSASGSDCSGAFSFDFNAQIQGGIDATLTAGSEVFAQYWSRDPVSASTTSLSNALRFLVQP